MFLPYNGKRKSDKVRWQIWCRTINKQGHSKINRSKHTRYTAKLDDHSLKEISTKFPSPLPFGGKTPILWIYK